MNTSPSIANLAKALAAAQGEMTFASKSSKNPFFNSMYADLAAVWDGCRAQLSKYGLAVIQNAEVTPEMQVLVETILCHESGEWSSSTLRLPVLAEVVEKGNPPIKAITAQTIGKAITYARRYALAATIGLAQADDDGNTASGKDAPKEPARMDEGAQANHRTAIEGADTLETLAKAYHAAIAAAGDDQNAQKDFISLTNLMKKKLGGPK